MTLLRYYNLTKGVAAFPGCTGTLASGEARSVTLEELDMDAYLENLMVRGPVMGLAATNAEEGSLPLFVGGTERFATLAVNGALGTDIRSAAITADGVVATLMAASAVPDGDLVRVVLDHAYAGATTGSVARAGADTIDGGATPVSLTVAAPLTTLRSDGVSAWVTV